MDDPDSPVLTRTVRSSHNRWVKAAGGSRLCTFVHVPGEEGCYFVAGGLVYDPGMIYGTPLGGGVN